MYVTFFECDIVFYRQVHVYIILSLSAIFFKIFYFLHEKLIAVLFSVERLASTSNRRESIVEKERDMMGFEEKTRTVQDDLDNMAKVRTD